MTRQSKRTAARPSIREVAERIGRKPGFDPPTPRWGATLAYLCGLPLSDADVAELVAATGRSEAAIRAHAERVVGRRRFRQLWARIGRRGRKSATAALIAIYEAVWGGHERFILPGEQALVAVISKDIAGASVISRFARLYLDALGIRWTTTRIGAVQLIEIAGTNIAIATLSATTEAPRGYAICCLILDEIAHAATGDEYVNTDKAILAAAEPAMAQFAEPLVIGISTGLGRDGVHYERVERGLGNDSEESILSVTGASWEWSADITREAALEIADGDADVMHREFEGGVSENEALWMPQEDARAMFEPREEHYLWDRPFMVIDAAESADTFAWCIGTWGEPDQRRRVRMAYATGPEFVPNTIPIGPARDEMGGEITLPIATRPLLWIYRVGGYDGPTVRQLGMRRVVAELATLAKQMGVHQVIGDDRAGPYLEALFSEHHVHFAWVSYSNKKHEAAVLCRAWARDRQVSIFPPHDEMRKQCLRYRRFVSGGTFKYGKANQRDDYVTLMLTLAVHLNKIGEKRREEARPIDGAPTIRQLGRKQVIYDYRT